MLGKFLAEFPSLTLKAIAILMATIVIGFLSSNPILALTLGLLTIPMPFIWHFLLVGAMIGDVRSKIMPKAALIIPLYFYAAYYGFYYSEYREFRVLEMQIKEENANEISKYDPIKHAVVVVYPEKKYSGLAIGSVDGKQIYTTQYFLKDGEKTVGVLKEVEVEKLPLFPSYFFACASPLDGGGSHCLSGFVRNAYHLDTAPDDQNREKFLKAVSLARNTKLRRVFHPR